VVEVFSKCAGFQIHNADCVVGGSSMTASIFGMDAGILKATKECQAMVIKNENHKNPIPVAKKEKEEKKSNKAISTTQQPSNKAISTTQQPARKLMSFRAPPTYACHFEHISELITGIMDLAASVQRMVQVDQAKPNPLIHARMSLDIFGKTCEFLSDVSAVAEKCSNEIQECLWCNRTEMRLAAKCSSAIFQVVAETENIVNVGLNVSEMCKEDDGTLDDAIRKYDEEREAGWTKQNKPNNSLWSLSLSLAMLPVVAVASFAAGQWFAKRRHTRPFLAVSAEEESFE
jgi:hypothetical protein